MAKVWMVTGASRGLGATIVQEALAAGHKVVATARDSAAVDVPEGSDDRLLILPLDVTDEQSAKNAVAQAVARFGRIDVLANNAGYGQLGPFEECSVEDVRRQFETNVFGLMAVCRAILPVMRAQKNGNIFNFSSLCGFQGGARYSVYAASKFAVEGFSESLAAEVKGFGIKVTIVGPGYFRTDFLDSSSIRFSSSSVEDYAESSARGREISMSNNGKQMGDPVKLAHALLKLSEEENPPVRFAVGADAVQSAQRKLTFVSEELEHWRLLSEETALVA
jgi:NAD(P)-dependent dehydrogenase (short-subunit alcohol dehydrogenase family)